MSLLFPNRNCPAHKVHYDLESLSRLLLSAGFTIQPLEWFDGCGCFHRLQWDGDDGRISRSAAAGGSLYLWLTYLCSDFWSLSLLVDAVKL